MDLSGTSSSVVTMTSLMSGNKRQSKIDIHKGILKYLKKEVEIPTEYESDDYEDKIMIYEGNSKSWYFLVISLADMPFGLVKKCDENVHDARKDLIDRYEFSDEKQKGLNAVTNRWENFRIKNTSQDPYILFNEIIQPKSQMKKYQKKV